MRGGGREVREQAAALAQGRDNGISTTLVAVETEADGCETYFLYVFLLW